VTYFRLVTRIDIAGSAKAVQVGASPIQSSNFIRMIIVKIFVYILVGFMLGIIVFNAFGVPQTQSTQVQTNCPIWGPCVPVISDREHLK
jgi:hypothetical protein